MISNIIKVLLSNFIITFVGLINSFIFPKLMNISGYSEYQTFLLYVSYINILHLGIASGMFVNYGGIPYEKIDKSRYKSEILLILLVLSFFTICGLGLYTLIGKNTFLYCTCHFSCMSDSVL